MKPDGLLAIYDRAVDTPNVTARLRRFVLDLAVRGKLVEQDPNDEPALALLEQITTEKARLARKGRASRTSATNSDSAHQLPFKLPAGWVKTTIGGICSKTGSGSTPRGGKKAYAERGIVFLRSQNIHNDGLRLTDVAYIDPATHKRMSGTAVRPSDLLLNITGGSIGRCCLVPDDLDQANVSQHVSIIRIAVDGPQRFLRYLILAPYFQAFILDEQTGAGRGGLPKYKMDRLPVALPPLAEQQRIVAKVDELIALCDDLEETGVARKETRTELTKTTLSRLSAHGANNATFRSHARFAIEALAALTARAYQVKNLRRTILDLAVRGKLVDQDPKDKPASELLTHARCSLERRARTVRRMRWKKTKPVAFDEIERDIPPGWVPARINDTGLYINGLAFKPADWKQSGLPIIRIQNLTNPAKEFNFAEGDFPDEVLVRDGDLLVSWSATLDAYKWDRGEAVLNQHIFRVLPDDRLTTQAFLLILLRNAIREMAESDHAHGLVMTHINRGPFLNHVILIPPLAEQHRVVAKFDELMTLCDRLEAGLSSVTATRSHLLESVLRAAL